MALRLNGSSSGYVELESPAAAGSNTLTLPTSNGAANQVLANGSSAGALGFANLPLNEFDQWMLTAEVTSDGDITANLARNNQEGAGSQIGTGMSQSSGIFTFPSTGKWLVIAGCNFNLDDADTVMCATNVTTNNSAYGVHTYALDGNNGTGERQGSGTSFAFLDVTDTTQVKVKFTAVSIAGDSAIRGNSDHVETSFIFIRLGDT
jgi:hypothetical protein